MKNVFEVLKEMNQHDTENGTRLLAVSNTLVEAKLTKQGTIVTMGCGESVALDLLNGKSKAILMIIDDAEFQKRLT